MAEEDISLEEKRVYGERADAETVFVATGAGLARVTVSDDIVGEFSLAYRGAVVDVAAAEGRLAVATPEDVLVGTDDGFVGTGFGPAAAVHYADELLAAGGGRIARYAGGWDRLCDLGEVRAIDGDMVAAASGVHRLDGTHVGLENANDVTTATGPLAATGAGLYYLANGWVRALEGSFRAVGGTAETAHAATAGAVYERTGGRQEWSRLELPVEERVVDVAHGAATYLVTEAGTVLVNAGEGWRHRSLGLPEASAVVVG